MAATLQESIGVLRSPHLSLARVGHGPHDASITLPQDQAEHADTSVSLAPRGGSVLTPHFTCQSSYSVGEDSLLGFMIRVVTYRTPQA